MVDPCLNVQARKLHGSLVWSDFNRNCSGYLGALTPVLHGHELWIRDLNVVLTA